MQPGQLRRHLVADPADKPRLRQAEPITDVSPLVAQMRAHTGNRRGLDLLEFFCGKLLHTHETNLVDGFLVLGHTDGA